MNEFNISIIIPTYNDSELLDSTIGAIRNQSYLPEELVIVDSSDNDEIKNSLNKLNVPFVITYLHEDKLYPYEASNLGASIAKGEWLAFLDTKTIPKSNWLCEYKKIIETKNIDIVFGVTKYLADTSFQNLLRDSTYGRSGHETAPGTFITKENFLMSGKIMSGVRSGGDIEWRNRLKSLNFKCITPVEIFLTYNSLPNKLIPTLKKFFIYQLHGSKVDIQHTVKDIYLGLTLLMSAIIIPKWNSIVGWEKSYFYMPNVTKIYLLVLVTFFLLVLILDRFFLKKSLGSFSQNIFKLLFFIFLFLIIFKWNGLIAGWIETSVWYVPHITKLYLGSILLASLLYRGVYFPLKHNVNKEFLFPFRWIQVGSLGLLLDLVKAPGYLIGALMMPFNKAKKELNKT
tara:strand:- start:10579 stop:11778 length:1200 start_codon:yes stop_codon:yes gene_type:complete